ncbi:hypothetical protein EHO61_06075 [Leptospira fluminis]|uniref:AAA+ ATPase domain-containing protein n=1 Tax=Leptospira fluminis TaxID=2484979 RepID=A0A4R9GSM1_9LEPT|nr:AAA family ATPase [Leptospira fluminis]TGK20073.1 hypothetical protein EHO61_06075 [Leptospira fluminis]
MNQLGSLWRKWDLHIHTPASIVQNYGSDDGWERFITELESLPAEIKVIGINDYLFIDGYKRVLYEKKNGKLKNIDLILPVIELRIDKFGGSLNHLSRLNFHIIFSDELSAELIENHFLNALSSKYQLTPVYDNLRTSAKWAALPTRSSLHDLGEKIINSVPEAKRVEFGHPLIEGFNNLCLSLDSVYEALGSHYFTGKFITAVGKTEWSDIKWNDHTIAEKKTIINSADFVFTSASSQQDWEKAHKSLLEAGVNSRLLDCSDSHNFSDSELKDRLGKCLTWIKSDPSFEGLKQALFEFKSRVLISEQKPIEPLFQIRKVKFNFPEQTKLKRQETQDDFCFRGNHEISFSPYLTSIIGGRGTGKSTILNLLHEKLDKGVNSFFKTNVLVSSSPLKIEDHVIVDGVSDRNAIDFLQQNEIEQFAIDQRRLTSAIYSRILKLDTSNVLIENTKKISDICSLIEKQIRRLDQLAVLQSAHSEKKKQLTTNKSVLDSFKDEDYQRISNELSLNNKQLLLYRSGKERYEELLTALDKIVLLYSSKSKVDSENPFETEIQLIVEELNRLIELSKGKDSIGEARKAEIELMQKASILKIEMQKFLTQRGLSAESLADAGAAAERVTELEEEISSIVKNMEAISEEIATFSVDEEPKLKYEESLRKLLATINLDLKNLSSEVRPIELHYEFDSYSMREKLIDNIVTFLADRSRRDHVKDMLEGIDLSSLKDAESISSKISDSTKTGKALKTFFSAEENLEKLRLIAFLEYMKVEEYGRIRVLYDNKPIESTSFGQRCTAVIVILIILGNTPIVIDEPEAHLDSSLIAKYLVELVKSRKIHRQIIFATHNANFVINGDSELIHCLSMDSNNKSSIDSITIEDLNHREKLLALEGGVEAFQKRELRYGID